MRIGVPERVLVRGGAGFIGSHVAAERLPLSTTATGSLRWMGLHKLEVLRESYDDDAALDQILGKLLDVVLDQQRARLTRYDRDLHEYETRYQMSSPLFYQHFEAGTLGDAADFFEWAGLYELRQELAAKVQRLEMAA